MRVLVLESAGNLWGSERALLDLIDGLPHNRVELAVCCPPNRPLQPELERRQLPVYPTFGYALHERGKFARLLAVLGLLRACISFRPDVIYVNQAGATKIAGMISRVLCIPVISHVRIFEDAAYLASLRPSRDWLRSMIAISDSIQNEIREFPALDKIPSVRLYDAYRPQNCSVDSNHVEIKNSLACVGRVAPVKGQEVLVDALHLVSMQGVRFSCVFAGGGDRDFFKMLQERSVAGPARESIEWLGNIDSVAKLLEQTSFLVCPSHREPLGRVIFEAWDAGCVPIVFEGSGGAAEVVSASGGGVLYSHQTAQSLAATIQYCLSLNHESRKELIIHGRKWIHENLCAANYGKSIADLFAQSIIPFSKSRSGILQHWIGTRRVP